MKNTICVVCGNEIKDSGTQKTGRPKQFHKECRELNNAFDLLHSRLEAFRNAEPKEDERKMIRKRLWSMANVMN